MSDDVTPEVLRRWKALYAEMELLAQNLQAMNVILQEKNERLSVELTQAKADLLALRRDLRDLRTQDDLS